LKKEIKPSPINAIDEGMKPIVDVTVGKARNPPPIVVPEVRRAVFSIDVISTVCFVEDDEDNENDDEDDDKDLVLSKIHDRREAFDLIELQTNSYILLMESNEN
jgi:hypothetical protein